ncbi:MAG: hypothetical protein GEU90_05120 [Gemmatimonas sp.]|nr:hypothetical protein [Gemmatimonas sp.]
MKLRPAALASAVLLLSGCASLNNIADQRGSGGGVGNAIVVEDEDFESSRGSMLSILQMHVRSMSVSRADVCPRIVVRAGAGRSQTANPLVYVDGQRMSDTCVLDALSVESVSSAEVYPSGVTNRPGYHSNSGGLILIFMKNGNEAPLWQ